MKTILLAVLTSLGSIGLFVGVTVMLMSMQGREVASLFVAPEPPSPDGTGDGGAEEEGTEDVGVSEEEAVEEEPKSDLPDAFSELYRTSVRTFKLPSGFSAEELTALADELKESLESNADLGRILEAEKAEISMMREGLDSRYTDLESSLENLESLSDEVQVEKQRIEDTVIVLRESEKVSLKNLAKIYEGMTAEAVSKSLEEMDEIEAAKLLSMMTARSAAEALSQMDAGRAASLALKLKSMVQESQLRAGE